MSIQKLSYRYALSFLLLIQILFFSPFWLSNNVVYHHSNYQQLTGLPDTTDTYKNNPKFADQSTVYIPEINQHLKKSRHNWVSTWNPSVQLGRPTFQLSGFSLIECFCWLLDDLCHVPVNILLGLRSFVVNYCIY